MYVYSLLCVYLVYLYPFYVIKQKVALFSSFPFPYHRTSTAAECMHMLWNSHQVFVQFVYFFPTSIDYRYVEVYVPGVDFVFDSAGSVC